MRGPAVQRALIGEKLFPEDVDACVRKARVITLPPPTSLTIDVVTQQVLELVKRAAQSGIPSNGPEKSVDTPEVRALLRKAAADGIVLLKNEKGLLPLSEGANTKRIAVIGPNAKHAVISGGGSASLKPTYTVSPLEGITAAAKKIGAEVSYTVGATSHKYLPSADPYISRDGQRGALFEFWNEAPTKDYLDANTNLSAGLPPSVWSTATDSSNCFLADGVVSTSVYDPGAVLIVVIG